MRPPGRLSDAHEATVNTDTGVKVKRSEVAPAEHVRVVELQPRGLGDGLLLHQLRHYIPLWSKLRATLPQKTGPEKLCGVLERPGYLSDATRRRAGAGTRRP